MEQRNADWMHKEYPKTCAPDDFWGQVKRTVKGQAVTQEQINIIVNAIRDGLHFKQTDILLDIGCGNGALTKFFFPLCSGVLGVDFSTVLISVAKKNFERAPSFLFIESDMLDYITTENAPNRFTKILCYGAFQYLNYDTAKKVLAHIKNRFINVECFFIGNLPDKDKIKSFYPPETDYSALVNDNLSPLGIWRTKSEFAKIGAEAGWKTEFRTMPNDFYASHYRYDVILRPV